MQTSPLQLDAYFLQELSFSLSNDLRKFPDLEVNFEAFDINVEDKTTPIDKGERSWRSEVIVETESKAKSKVPYKFKVVMVGFFSVDENYPEDRSQILAETNAPSILYASIREIVLSMTTRSPFPGLLLPSITFLKQQTDVKRPTRRSPTSKKIAKS